MEPKKTQVDDPVVAMGKASAPRRAALSLATGGGKTATELAPSVLERVEELSKKGSRLRHARLYLKLSGAAFGAPIGKAKGTISQWESGAVDYSLSDSLAIEHVWGISSNWLMLGQGPLVSAHSPQYMDRRETGFYLIPLLDGLPSCGPSGAISDMGEDAEGLPFSGSFIDAVLRQCGAGSSSSLFVARVQGDSMVPTIQGGDTVMVNTALPLRIEPRKGALHLVRRGLGSSEARVKRVFLSLDQSHLTLLSDNPSYPPVSIPVDGVPIQELVVGRVCWYGRTVLDQLPKPEDW